MDGLLLDSERLCMECFTEASRLIGHKVDPEIYMRCIGTNAATTKRILIDGHGDSFPYDQLLPIWNELYHRKITDQAIPLKSGAKEILQILNNLRVPIGIATSTSRELALTKLSNADISVYFDFVIGGDQVCRGKPDPEIYLAAVKQHKVEAHQCIAFEDSENGVLAAHRAGVSVIQVPDLVAPTSALRSLGHKIVNSLHEVDFDSSL